ncbi:MAG: MarR family transcriptional regulator [archaeon]
MENKHVGWLIVGIGVVMAIVVIMFDSVLRQNLGLTCSHGPTCEMYTSLNVQTWISLAIVAVVIIIGIVIMLTKPKERIIIKKIKEKKKKLNLNGLDKDEKKVISLIQEEGNAIFQASLMEKLEIGKVKATRLLDKLESKGLIERKRRGMNNIVVLKD